MFRLLVDYGVPANVFLLMLIAGTEIGKADFTNLRRQPLAVLLGSAGQLLLLPPLALLILATTSPLPSIAVGILLLALSPGGGISNYYCYLASCNVLLSATITAASTVLSLFTIPLWLSVLPALPIVGHQLPAVPVTVIMMQLLVLMIVPLTIGLVLRHVWPESIKRAGRPLRWLSLFCLALVLGLSVWSVRETLLNLGGKIVISSAIFILAAMVVGWLLGLGLSKRDRAVLTIESGVRNVGIALSLGGILLPSQDFGIFASFIAGYFAVEAVIMVTYARLLARGT